MGLDALLCALVIAGVFAMLATDRYASDFVVVGGLSVLLVAGVLDPGEAFAGFASPAVVALAGLYLLTAALRETGALDRPAHLLLSSAADTPTARRRLTSVTTVLSAFLNNTPVVAMFMPVASRWARQRGVSAHGLLLPLSYAAVLGGVCTLMGTATHLVVHGLLIQRGMPGLSVFELAPVGIPVALVGLPLTWLLAKHLLKAPAEGSAADPLARREYYTSLQVTEDSPLLGQTVEDAGLRHLDGLFLVRVERGDHVIAPVHPGVLLLPGDQLTFAGVLDTIVDLQKQRGFAAIDSGDLDHDWALNEAVVSRGSPLVGLSIRDANFRGQYNAAVVAVHRHGEHLDSKIGDITLRHGDTLLLQAAPGFARTFRDTHHFYLVSAVHAGERPRHKRAPLALAIMGAVVATAGLGLVDLATAAVAGSMLMIATGCLSTGQARRSIDLSVLMVIGAALGIARAFEKTGLADALADQVLVVAPYVGSVGTLVVVYIVGMLLTEVVTNTAAAALLLPVALAVAANQGLDPRAFALATTIAASLSLATPLGYQTNMMVYGPGGYRFTDFLRMGVPIQLVLGAVAVAVLSLRYGL